MSLEQALSRGTALWAGQPWRGVRFLVPLILPVLDISPTALKTECLPSSSNPTNKAE